jgi:hypothetical protein
MTVRPGYSTQRHSLRLISPFHLLSPATVLESLPKNAGSIWSPPAGDADGERPCRLGFSFREGAGAGGVAVSSHALEGAMDLWPRSDACRWRFSPSSAPMVGVEGRLRDDLPIKGLGASGGCFRGGAALPLVNSLSRAKLYVDSLWTDQLYDSMLR